LNVCYIDSIEMVNRFVEASRTSSTDENSYNKFNDFFLDADVLLIDDIQRLRDAGGTLGAFFRIFNNLMGSGKQIVMSSDRAPKNIGLDDRYISRFNSGITIDIQPPDFETKRSIARNFLAQLEEDKGFKTDISSEVIDYLADNSSDNVRELKSAVSRLFYENKNKPETDLSLQRVKELLSNHFLNNAGSKITVETVQGAVEDFYKISHADLVGKKRSRNIAHPRQVAIYLMRNLLGLTQKELGEIFNRDHSTIKHSYDLIDGQKEEDFNLREELEAIREKIRTQQF